MFTKSTVGSSFFMAAAQQEDQEARVLAGVSPCDWSLVVLTQE